MPAKTKAPKPQSEFERECADSWVRHDEVLPRGPNGAPVYDKLGYELDYKKVAASNRPRRPLRGSTYLRILEIERKEHDKKVEIMDMDKNQVSAMTLMRWDDRIARDSEIPYHKVEFEHYEEWYEKGFRTTPGEYARETLTEEEHKRISDLATGSFFRK